ncbi:hypothetical protein TWF481_007325 [Arthrobotrys musiformis]|uniref:FAS1 domain-containing protein n=1 Tax=Arthrobotrys musiformis TaxID=47236 RepID=A0AAV9WBC5_9PEZI
MRCWSPVSTLVAFIFFITSFQFIFAVAILPVVDFGPTKNPQNPFIDMDNSQDNPMVKSGSGPIVSDALSVQRDVSIFSDIVRGLSDHQIVDRLEDKSQNTTVLAPLNSAVKALPRKPWEDPDPRNNVEGAFFGDDGEKKAAANLERFVKAHIVPVSPFKENEKVQTLEGVTVWWTTENGITKLYPGGIEVKEVKSPVPNGQIWILTGVVPYA